MLIMLDLKTGESPPPTPEDLRRAAEQAELWRAFGEAQHAECAKQLKGFNSPRL